MSFAKLDSDITKSSMWDQPDYVVRVWIAFLAEKDESGFVRGTMQSMRRISNVHDDPDGEKYAAAIKCLESPDPDSRTKNHDGRRIERVDGGWVVLNHDLYRLREDAKKDSHREYMRKWRENKNHGEFTNIHNDSQPITSLSPSVSVSVSESEEGGVGGETERLQNATVPSVHLNRHMEFLSSGPDEWMNWDYASGKEWSRTFQQNVALSPDDVISGAKLYRRYIEAAKPDKRFIKQPHNWLREGGWTVDWAEKIKPAKPEWDGIYGTLVN